MAISLEDVKKLRAATGSGISDAKKALEQTDGDFDKAVEILRVKGQAKAASKSSRVAAAGIIDSYIHAGRIGVLVEVNCETDFVARTGEFKEFTRDLAMHIAATSPEYIDSSDIPEDVLEKEASIHRASAEEEGKSGDVLEKIVSGRLDKYYETACLMQQPFVKNPDQKIANLVSELSAKLGENIVIRRMARFELGEISG